MQSELKASEGPRCDPHELAPADVFDPVIEAYKKDLDLGLIRENLKRSVEERITRIQDAVNTIHEIRHGRGFEDTTPPLTSRLTTANLHPIAMPSHFVTPANLQHSDFPWCHVETMSNPEIVGAKELILVRATFPPHAAHKFHVHPGREEIIYVLQGQAEQWVEKEKRVLNAGEMAHIPKNTPHATRNPNATPLLFLAILSPVEAPGEFTVDVFDQEPWRTIWTNNQ